MDSAPPAYAEAAAVAGLVPRLLATQVEPAELSCGDAVTAAIERSADRLLIWHDVIVGVRPVAHLSQRSGMAGADVATHASADLAEAVHAGGVPGSPPSLELAAHELLHVSRQVRRIAEAPAVRDSCRHGGIHLADSLERLADGLQAHAELLRDESRRLDELQHSRRGSGPAEETIGQVLARIVRAEHALQRLALGTLPQ